MRVLIVLLIVAACYAAHKIRDQQFQIQGIEVYDEVSSRERRQVNQNYVRPSFGREDNYNNFQQQPNNAFVSGYTMNAPVQPFRPKSARLPQLRTGRPFGREHTDFVNWLKFQRVANGAADPQATKYYYPPRQPLPLPKCFHNPTGYVCCNVHLNDMIVDTYTELESRPKFHSCNINLIARELQNAAEKRFNTTFETLVSYEDFAQKIHFHGDYVCKVELGGRYMLAYGTAKDVQQGQLDHGALGPLNEIPRHLAKRNSMLI
ncbi:hypothetical protein QR680_018445 [Steinernema hermaphroditum]|uniref:Ground-like domain-containing protein n=1 Tax=Steinernema hermaphroditum TaxID=289476 RepID=A0AA39HHZ8_9BILA|nr:hypothetical protein QR680_018445 [Steinernema hermaphroditum]